MRPILGAAAGVALLLASALATGDVAGAVHPAAPHDFDGDGYADLAVGVPDEAGGGAVNVLYGSRAGITAAGDQYWTQDSPGVKGVRAKGDKFGRAIASADFDRDGYADLAIGVPREPGAGGTGTRGAVNVLYGSPSGLTAAGDQLLTRQQFAVPGGWFFGEVLLAAELTGDGYPDLVVGTPGSSLVVIAGGATGLRTTGARLLVPSDTAAPSVGFGDALAAGDFDGDGHGDLVIGLPLADIGTADLAGMLQVVYGSDAGLDVATVQTWSQDSPGILDEAELGYAYDTDGQEMFGARLAVGDFDGDGRDDLAVGVPEDLGSEGVVNVIYGSADGLAADGNQLWTTTGLSRPGVVRRVRLRRAIWRGRSRRRPQPRRLRRPRDREPRAQPGGARQDRRRFRRGDRRLRIRVRAGRHGFDLVVAGQRQRPGFGRDRRPLRLRAADRPGRPLGLRGPDRRRAGRKHRVGDDGPVPSTCSMAGHRESAAASPSTGTRTRPA